jgi:hypothetical protein
MDRSNTLALVWSCRSGIVIKWYYFENMMFKWVPIQTVSWRDARWVRTKWQLANLVYLQSEWDSLLIVFTSEWPQRYLIRMKRFTSGALLSIWTADSNWVLSAHCLLQTYPKTIYPQWVYKAIVAISTQNWDGVMKSTLAKDWKTTSCSK